MDTFMIGIDQGTTGTFVGMMNQEGRILHQAYGAHQQIYPRPGWVEHDPEEIWSHVVSLLNQVASEAEVPAEAIAGIGIANQGESVVLWDATTGQAVSNVIVWQDTRTQEAMDALLADRGLVDDIQARTGLRPDAYFSASKLRWLLDNTPGAKELLRSGNLRCGTLDTWMIWKLTDGSRYVTDVSTASRTLLFNIHTLSWDGELLELFHIPRDILAEVAETTGDFGELKHPAIHLKGVPILASLVDQPAAMVGQGCLRSGSLKATYGTGCFLNLNTGQNANRSRHGLLALLAWQRAGLPTYGLDGGVFSAGASLNWLKDKANLVAHPGEIDALCGQVQDDGGVVWVPAQVGLGAPYWERNIRAAWLGVDLATERGHLVRAVLEGIALRVVQIIRAMEVDSQFTISHLRADGGLTRSAALMQLQADLLGRPVEVLEDQEATARGVCSLVARQAGIWTSDEPILAGVQVARTHTPTRSAAYREERLARFERAVSMVTSWTHE